LISNSNLKIQFEFEKVFNIKLVYLEILKISYFGNFSSHYMILGVIWQKQFKGSCVLGVLHYTGESGQQRTAWAPTRPAGAFLAASRRRHGNQ
jgi:hypothetical protein